MATNSASGGFSEHCEECGIETPHSVTIEIAEGGDDTPDEMAKYAREPHRVRTCQSCGRSTSQRIARD